MPMINYKLIDLDLDFMEQCEHETNPNHDSSISSRYLVQAGETEAENGELTIRWHVKTSMRKYGSQWSNQQRTSLFVQRTEGRVRCTRDRRSWPGVRLQREIRDRKRWHRWTSFRFCLDRGGTSPFGEKTVIFHSFYAIDSLHEICIPFLRIIKQNTLFLYWTPRLLKFRYFPQSTDQQLGDEKHEKENVVPTVKVFFDRFSMRPIHRFVGGNKKKRKNREQSEAAQREFWIKVKG